MRAALATSLSGPRSDFSVSVRSFEGGVEIHVVSQGEEMGFALAPKDALDFAADIIRMAKAQTPRKVM